MSFPNPDNYGQDYGCVAVGIKGPPPISQIVKEIEDINRRVIDLEGFYPNSSLFFRKSGGALDSGATMTLSDGITNSEVAPWGFGVEESSGTGNEAYIDTVGLHVQKHVETDDTNHIASVVIEADKITFSPNSGNINLSGNPYGSGGSINTSNNGGSINTSGGQSGFGGSINLSAGANEDGNNGGSIISTAGEGSGASGGTLNMSGGTTSNTSGGSINTSGGTEENAFGGYISTKGWDHAGGFIDTSNGGGSITTSNGGGEINTSSGFIELGTVENRLSLQSRAFGKTCELPDVNGIALVASANGISSYDSNYTVTEYGLGIRGDLYEQLLDRGQIKTTDGGGIYTYSNRVLSFTISHPSPIFAGTYTRYLGSLEEYRNTNNLGANAYISNGFMCLTSMIGDEPDFICNIDELATNRWYKTAEASSGLAYPSDTTVTINFQFANGGSINTSCGGGSIDTRGKGSIEFGVEGTRTTLNGSASGSNRLITLPNASGTLPVSLISASTSLSFGSISASGGILDLTITLTGASVGDVVFVTCLDTGGRGSTDGKLIFEAFVSAVNVVTVRAHNPTTGPIGPGTYNFKVAVIKIN